MHQKPEIRATMTEIKQVTDKNKTGYDSLPEVLI